MPEFEHSEQATQLRTYFREELEFSEDAVHQVIPILATIGVMHTARNMGAKGLRIGSWQSKPWRLFYRTGAQQIALVHEAAAGAEIHLPVELFLTVIVLARRLTESILFLFEPTKWLQDIYEKTWDVHADVLPNVTENFLTGKGQLLSLFSNFDGTAPIERLATEVRLLLDEKARWGKNAQQLAQTVAVSCFAFIYGHECAHILRQHVTFRPRLIRLKENNSEKYKRISNAMECEADIHAFSFLSNIADLQLVGFSETEKDGFDPESLFPNRKLTNRCVLGLTAFGIMALRSFWVFTHKGQAETMRSLYVRSHLVANAEYSQRERKIIRVEPDYTDEEWLSGYSVARSGLRALVWSKLGSDPCPIASDLAIPPYCLVDSDSIYWTSRPPDEESWAILEEEDEWIQQALVELRNA